MKPIIPSGMSGADFENACRELRSIVGDEWVITAEDDLASYYDPYSPGLADRHAPAGAVAPATIDEIRGVLRIANTHHLPLWTVSTGKNYAYGGAAPCLRGSMILDLKRMQRIEVNEELAYAIVEPGVSYFDLYRFIRDRGYRLWIDCPTPGWGSVLGNALERGIGYTPYADHAANQCGMEIVLANGDLVRTGMGAMTDNPTWALHKYGFGPSLDGLFMQSNFGVVTKIGLWLMPEPEFYSVVDIMFQAEEDIVAIIDTLRPLRLHGTIPSASIANWMRMAAWATTRAQWYDGQGAMPKSAIRKLISSLDLGWWGLRFGLYGRKEIVEANFKIVQQAFSRIPRARVARTDYKRGMSSSPAHALLSGTPGLDFMMLNWTGGAGAHIECPPVVPAVGKPFFEFYLHKTELFRQHGFDHHCGLTSISPRSFVNTGSIIFDRNDDAQTERARALSTRLISETARSRLGAYRSHIAEMDLAAAQFDFNSWAAMRLYETLKDSLDPEGILSPGKQGIWPQRLRPGLGRPDDAR